MKSVLSILRRIHDQKWKISSVFLILLVGNCMGQESQEKTDFVYGERLYNEGLYELARMQFESFVGDYPSSPKAVDALYLVGECETAMGNYEAAQKSYLHLILRYPNAAMLDHAQFRIAECFEKRVLLEDARASYLRMPQFYPESDLVLLSLYRGGMLSVHLGELKTAENAFRYLIEKAPPGNYRAMAQFALADLHKRNGEYEKALVILKTLETHPITEKDAENAAYQSGIIYEEMGRLQDAETSYLKAVRGKDSAISGLASLSLGRSYLRQGEITRAREALLQAVSMPISDADLCTAYEAMAKLEVRSGDLRAALDAIERAQGKCDDTHRLHSLFILKADCLQGLNRDDEAAFLYESILQGTPEESVFKKAIWKLARFCESHSNPERAVELYRDYISRFDSDPLRNAAMVQASRLLVHDLDMPEEALPILRKMVQYKVSDFSVPEGYFLYGKALEKMNRTEAALNAYRKLLHFPETVWADSADNRIRTIENFYVASFGDELARFTLLLQDISQNPSPDLIFRLGVTSFSHLKQYETALVYFDRYRKSGRTDRQDSVLFYMAESHRCLYEKKHNPLHMENEQQLLEELLANHPGSALSPIADERLGLLLLKKNEDDAAFTLKNRYSTAPGPLRDQLLYMHGLQMMKSNPDSAAFLLARVVDAYPDSRYRERALFALARHEFKKNQFEKADSLLDLYQKYYPEDGYRIPAGCMKAIIAINRGDYHRSIQIFESLNPPPFFSPWSDTVSIRLGDLYLKESRYEEACNVFVTALQIDSLKTWTAELGLNERDPLFRKSYLERLAKAYTGKGDLKRAGETFLILGAEDSSGENTIRVLTGLSSISEKQGNQERSENYLTRLLELVPQDSIAEALGLLKFRMEKYPEAVTIFNSAIKMTASPSRKAFLTSRTIISTLRQRQIAPAEAAVKQFSDQFKKEDNFKTWMAELIFERGKAYFNNKEFELAIKDFEEVVKKYKDTDIRPEAELEIGRTYLVTNKTEEALKTLTQMVTTYSGHPIQSKVLLNLGDHYFRSKQLDNALRAFQRIVEDSSRTEIRPLAIRYLLRVYDMVGMWDPAIMLARRYINEYPYADDILQKRVQIGNFYRKMNEHNRAIEVFREVQDEADMETQAEIQYWIGECYFSMGLFEQSIFEFLKVEHFFKSTRLPWASTALYEAGQAFLKLDKKEEARKLFEKIVRSEGVTSDLGRIARQRIDEIEAGLAGK